MTNEKFNAVVQDQLELCERLLIKKGEEYDRGSIDRLHAFKVAAAMQQTSQQMALAGMMAKHTTSIYDLIRDGTTDIMLWDEKITDHINYLLLLKAIIIEEAEHEQN